MHAWQVCAGSYSCYALDKEGAVYAWGGGTDGCLGVGGMGDRAIPRPVALGTHCVKEIVAGGFHVMAITAGGA